MAPHAHAPTDTQPNAVHGDDGNSTAPVLIAMTGLCVLLGMLFAAIAIAVSRRVAGLDIGWRPPPTVVWVLAGATVAVLVWSAVLAAVVFPDWLRAHRRLR
jgi:hypothetical protein